MLVSNRATILGIAVRDSAASAAERHFVYAYGDNTYGQFGTGYRASGGDVLVKVRLLDRVSALSGYENYAVAVGESEGIWHWGDGPLGSKPAPSVIPVGGAKLVGICAGKPGVLAWEKNFVSLFDRNCQRTKAMTIKKAVAYEDTFLVLTEDGRVVKASDGRTLCSGVTDLAGAGTWASLAVADSLKGRVVIQKDRATVNVAMPTKGTVLVRPGKLFVVQSDGEVFEATEADNFSEFKSIRKPPEPVEVLSVAALDTKIVLYTKRGLVSCPDYSLLSFGQRNQPGVNTSVC
jgi:hypothetical protein